MHRERAIFVGKMMSIILCQGHLDQVNTWRGAGQTVIEHVSGNTSNTAVGAYLYAVAKWGRCCSVAFGTDFNGFAGLPGPRFGAEAAPGGTTHAAGQQSLCCCG